MIKRYINNFECALNKYNLFTKYDIASKLEACEANRHETKGLDVSWHFILHNRIHSFSLHQVNGIEDERNTDYYLTIHFILLKLELAHMIMHISKPQANLRASPQHNFILP